MTTHLSNEIVERFHAQSLVGGDKGVIRDHILSCESCRLRIVDTPTQAVALRAISEHFMPDEDEELYHLDYPTIEAFVDDKLEPIDRSTAKMHLEDCAECSAEVEDLRESLATMKAVSREVERKGAEHAPQQRRATFAPPMRIAAMVAFVLFAAVALVVIWKSKSPAPSQTPGVDRTAGNQPTPLASPQLPGFAPSPGIVNPPKVVENLRNGLSKPPTPNVAVLKDGNHEITIDQAGNVVGLPTLPSESRQAVKDALTSESLTRPNVLEEVASADVSTRAPSEKEERIKIVSPASTVIVQDRPILRWISSKTADAYRLEIADETFRQVAKSDELPRTAESWSPTISLKRGQIYTWTIRAVANGGELSPLSSQGKFKILSDDKMRELTQLKTAKSHLALGLFYASEGMVEDAEHEFGILVKDNPDSALAKKLLREVLAWRKR